MGIEMETTTIVMSVTDAEFEGGSPSPLVVRHGDILGGRRAKTVAKLKQRLMGFGSYGRRYREMVEQIVCTRTRTKIGRMTCPRHEDGITIRDYLLVIWVGLLLLVHDGVDRPLALTEENSISSAISAAAKGWRFQTYEICVFSNELIIHVV